MVTKPQEIVMQEDTFSCRVVKHWYQIAQENICRGIQNPIRLNPGMTLLEQRECTRRSQEVCSNLNNSEPHKSVLGQSPQTCT